MYQRSNAHLGVLCSVFSDESQEELSGSCARSRYEIGPCQNAQTNLPPPYTW